MDATIHEDGRHEHLVSRNVRSPRDVMIPSQYVAKGNEMLNVVSTAVPASSSVFFCLVLSAFFLHVCVDSLSLRPPMVAAEQ